MDKNNIELSSLYDLDMERAILSSIILNNDALSEIYDLIGAKDFYLKAHSDIFKAMIECLNSDVPIASSFLKTKLGKSYNEAVLTDILGTNGIVDIKKYANELKEKSVKRSILKMAQDMPGKVSQDKPSRDMVDEISSELYNLTDVKSTGSIKESKEIVNDFLEYIKKQSQLDEKDTVGLSTGFKSLDEKTNGFKNGDLIIVAARPGMGKTTICLNFIEKALSQNKGVVFFSLEMPAEQIMMRMLSAKTSIPLQSIISAKMEDDELTKLSDACEYMSSRKLFVHDSGYVNIHQIRTQLRKLKTSHKEISLCVIDYIGLMMSTSNFNERHLQIAEISRGLKLLARELDIPIIALSQLNRGLESRSNKRPMLSDLRESGAIEQDADMIFFIFREEVYREQEEKEREERAKAEGKEYVKKFVPENKLQEKAEIIIGKNRNGEPGIVEVIFKKDHSKFVEKAPMPDSVSEFKG
ncbi:replicative DNA helicase [Campylobacter pinnipediorum subsp. caledonicus]|uniref:Replicative DNA helicase n=1 Tax=Campylobacter pinnipediorum subsp. caledonicus TaxID=1874362 RepID=A0A1S6U779_9BACT|nr:replicative DNA helicase [Campylobacter pinnipediorum]AQW85999.1 replicative DNA helicase [Campylobacter pinnipediorum subsp. caledonicus]AQW87606.1 replicative DNA helicase [Campylobacter pinnipediorum subsp. caledonicus]